MNRIKLMLALAVASILGALSFGVAPAQAAFGGACAGNSFCLYQWKDLDGPTAGSRWQSSYTNIYNHSGHCLNIPAATWANGDPVSDNSASAMLTTNANGGAWSGYSITMFNWTNCNSAGQWKVLDYLGDNTSDAWNDLAAIKYQYPSGSTMTLYHTVTSILVECVSC